MQTDTRVPMDGKALARSAAVLMVARPAGALAFIGGLVLLPRWAKPSVVDAVAWSYFAYLFITSILNLGLERLVGPWVGRHPAVGLPKLMGPVLTIRLATIPLAGAASWLVLAVVGVHLPFVVMAWTVVWIGAGLVGSLVYATLRVDGRTTLEAGVSVTLRVAQAIVIIPAATEGWSAAHLVGTVASFEVLAALVLLRLAHLRPSTELAALRELPWRLLGQYTLLEVVAFLYLRVDVLAVGRLIGPAQGVTYSLLYRVIDAAVALVTPLVLVLYPQAAIRVAAGSSLTAFRRMGLAVVPTAMAALAGAGALAAPLLVDLVPRYDGQAPVLRILLGALPLIVWNAVELHLRAAEGATDHVLRLGAVTLMVAALVSVPAIELWGLRGAAIGVFLAEAVEVILLARKASREVRMSALAALVAAAALVLLAPLAEVTSFWWCGAIALVSVSACRLVGQVRELR